MSRVFASDPITKVDTLWHEDIDGRVVVETVHDVSDIVEDCKVRYNAHDERSRWKGDMVKVASIPLPVYFELFRKGITKNKRDFKTWLNERDNRVFRTRPGRV